MGLCRQTVIGQWCLRIEQYDITYDTIIRYIQTPFTVRQEQPLVSPFSFPFISFPPLLSVFLSLPLLLFFSLTSSHLLLLLLPSSLSSSIGLSHRLDIRFFFLLFFLIIYLYFPPLPSFFVFIPVAFFSAWCCLILIFFFFFYYYIYFFLLCLSLCKGSFLILNNPPSKTACPASRLFGHCGVYLTSSPFPLDSGPKVRYPHLYSTVPLLCYCLFLCFFSFSFSFLFFLFSLIIQNSRSSLLLAISLYSVHQSVVSFPSANITISSTTSNRSLLSQIVLVRSKPPNS